MRDHKLREAVAPPFGVLDMVRNPFVVHNCRPRPIVIVVEWYVVRVNLK